MASADRESAALEICHVNCQSLYAHLDEFRAFFENSEYQVICMSETWLKPAISDDMVALRDYTLFRRDRLGRGGGGVAFFLHNSLSASILAQSSEVYCRKPEFIVAEVALGSAGKLLLAVIYRPPNYGSMQDFEDIFLGLQSNYSFSVILGDMNTDMLSSTYDSRQLGVFIESSGLYLVPYTATHHTRFSSTLLDLCIVNDPDMITGFGQRDVNFLSAHDLIYVACDIRVRRRQGRTIRCRDFRDFDAENFFADLRVLDWSLITLQASMDQKIGIFNRMILGCYDKHAPLRTVCCRNLPAPWLTDDIRGLMRARDEARRAWRRRRNDQMYSAYKRLRNRVQGMIRSAKSNYYLGVFSARDRPALMWKNLRHLGLIKSKSAGRPLVCTVEDLNDFFAQTVVDRSGEASAANGLIGSGRSGEMSVVTGLSESHFDDNNFYWSYVTPTMILDALAGAKSEAEGCDGRSH